MPASAVKQRLADEMPDEMARADWRRSRAIENRAERRANLNRTEGAFVVGDARGQRRHQRVSRVGVGIIEHDIDAAIDLRRRAVIIYCQRIARHMDSAGDGQRRVKTIDRYRISISPIGQGADGRANRLLRPVEDQRRDLLNVGQVVFFQHFDQLAGADLIADLLRVDVADDLIRHADVGADDIKELAVGCAPP